MAVGTTERGLARFDRVAVTPRRREGVIGHTVADEMVLFNTATETAVSLNLTAAAVWELCDGATSVQRIIEVLADDSGMTPEEIGEDVERALRDMEGLSLLDLPGTQSAKQGEARTPADGSVPANGGIIA